MFSIIQAASTTSNADLGGYAIADSGTDEAVLTRHSKVCW